MWFFARIGFIFTCVYFIFLYDSRIQQKTSHKLITKLNFLLFWTPSSVILLQNHNKNAFSLYNYFYFQQVTPGLKEGNWQCIKGIPFFHFISLFALNAVCFNKRLMLNFKFNYQNNNLQLHNARPHPTPKVRYLLNVRCKSIRHHFSSTGAVWESSYILKKMWMCIPLLFATIKYSPIPSIVVLWTQPTTTISLWLLS